MTRTALCLALFVALTPAQERQEPPRFRVAVDAVRIDAVVTDRDGRIVSDLDADDFEIRQDGKPQKVTFAEFVPIVTPTPPAPSAAPPTGAAAPALPAAPAQVSRESVQRTFAIVVDDLGLSVESFTTVRKALHEFVNRQVAPGDLVALVRTGGSLGGLRPFTVDRRALHTAIEALQWNGMSRNGVEPFESINDTGLASAETYGSSINPADFSAVDRVRAQMSTLGTLGALNLITRSARDLPGRKAIVLVTDGFELPKADDSPLVREALDRAIDQAARVGVLIYALDARGLQTGGLLASDNVQKREGGIRSDSGRRMGALLGSQEAMAYLAEQTGGFAVRNTNDLPRGLGRIIDDVRSYYVIGYVPTEDTFKRVDNKVKLHNVSVKVRRPGLRVKTRKAFLGVMDADEPPSELPPAHQLIHAAVSPFVATDIALRATTLPGYGPDRGMFVRALLHIDASALTFADADDGKKTASADVLGMAFDHDGTEVAHLSTAFSVALTPQATQDALRDGLAYNLRIPIRRAGGYQVRFAVRDRQSGAIGSTGEFVEIPDVAHGAFALSGILLRADAAEDGDARRWYAAGARLTYAYDIYNAAGPVQSSASVWRGAQRIMEIPPVALQPPAGRERLFAASGGIKLGEQLPPGNYVLQIAATTANAREPRKTVNAVQRIAFDVR